MLNNYSLLIENLNKNNIDVIFCKNKNDVKEQVAGMLFEGATISNGGSVSLSECGIFDIFKDKKYNYLDRNRPGITPDEQFEIYKKTLDCDFYFCSSNAVTENGELINVDGNCNRISAISFGPKKVVMIVGTNKIVKDVEEGILRVKKTAAPLNTKRLGLDTPCNKLGCCVSLLKSQKPAFTDGCRHKNRICRNYLVSAFQREKGRITVILVDEALGY